MEAQNEYFQLKILSDPNFIEFNKFVGAYKFGDPVALVFHATESFINCEILHRKAERASVLELPKGISEQFEKISLLHNNQGLRRLKRALSAVNKAVEMYPNVVKKEDELVSEREMKEILVDYDLMFKNEIFEMDISGEEAKEIWVEYGNARKVIADKGMGGLIEYFGEKIVDLEKGRKNLTIGRKHTSPLPMWKIVLIAICLAASIASVAYCYKKQDCKWVWRMVKAIGGALFQTLLAGC